MGAPLTISAGLHGCFDVPDALHGNAVLIVAINVLIFQFANLVNENTELVGHIRNILVASFTPDGELLLNQ